MKISTFGAIVASTVVGLAGSMALAQAGAMDGKACTARTAARASRATRASAVARRSTVSRPRPHVRPLAVRGPRPPTRRSSRRRRVGRQRGDAAATASPRPLRDESPRFGLGFRTQYAEELALAPRSVDWVELVSDHYLGVGGPRRALLERLCREHPVALHGVGLGVAGSDPLDLDYLEALRELVARCEPVYVSDHLCWTMLDGRQSHDLLPIAYTGDVLKHVAERVSRVQDRIGRPLLLENATAYVAFRASEMDEPEFLTELSRETGCGVLLDVNNLYVNAMNLGSDPRRALALLPERRRLPAPCRSCGSFRCTRRHARGFGDAGSVGAIRCHRAAVSARGRDPRARRRSPAVPSARGRTRRSAQTARGGARCAAAERSADWTRRGCRRAGTIRTGARCSARSGSAPSFRIETPSPSISAGCSKRTSGFRRARRARLQRGISRQAP